MPQNAEELKDTQKQAVKDFIRYCDKFETAKITLVDFPVGEALMLGDIEAKIKISDTAFTKIDRVYDNLWRSDFEHSAEETETYKAKYHYIMQQYCKLSGSLEQKRKECNQNLNQERKTEEKNSSSNILKLPAIEIPKFSGDYLDWVSFRDIYCALVHDNSSLKPINKFHYLKSKLEGQAAHLISNYSLTDINYEPAWEALKKRYENPRILLNVQLKRLFSLGPPKQDNARNIRMLHDTIIEIITAIKNENIHCQDWDPLLIYLVCQSLPRESLKLWEQSLESHSEIPKWEELLNFLSERFRTLEAIDEVHSSVSTGPQRKAQSYSSQPQQKCLICKENSHLVIKCQKFLNLDIPSRISTIQSNKLCCNCFANHTTKTCSKANKCRLCNKKHHTLLHLDNSQAQTNNSNQSNSKFNATSKTQTQTNTNFQPNHPTNYSFQPSSNTQASTQSNFHNTPTNSHTDTSALHINKTFSTNCSTSKMNTILATAIINIKIQSKYFQVRALIDPGSEISLITEKIVKSFGIRTSKISATISGIGGSNTSCNKKSKITLLPKFPNYKPIIADFLILKRLTQFLPSQKPLSPLFPEYKNLEWADPDYETPKGIDMILGSDLYPSIILEGLIKNQNNTAAAIKTIFGWVVLGKNPSEITNHCYVTSFCTESSIDSDLKRFWELEEINDEKILSPEEDLCEIHFRHTHSRLPNGSYMVELPFNKNFNENLELGRSRNSALFRFLSLERKFDKNPKIKYEYDQVIKEYINLGHVSHCSNVENFQKVISSFYLPHHCVVKESSLTTKLRVVFDGSAKSSNQVSLNDCLYAGPALQQDLSSILINWRRFPIAATSDIEKMFRQIFISPKHTEFQRFLYRFNKSDLIQDFKLDRLVFGLKPSPFLAIRTLLQLANDEETKYPKAAEVLRNSTYVDDCLIGSYSENEFVTCTSELISMLRSGGFELRKWISNRPELLSNIPKNHKTINFSLTKNFDINYLSKTLGIQWAVNDDLFTFKLNWPEIDSPITKRKLFSQISKIFDPLGLLAPIVMNGKLLIQKIWRKNIDWDEEIPEDIIKEWSKLSQDLPLIENIKIPRWYRYNLDNPVQFHFFCDASTKAYATCCYIRIENNNQIYSNLVTSKTKIAPIKFISLPRLELCAAVLLSKLVKFIKTTIKMANVKYYAWSDSQVALAWINSNPSKWKPFIGNRVAKIHDLIDNIPFNYVNSKENPADFPSRGQSSKDLVKNKMWWKGPTWLLKSESFWPLPQKIPETCLEERKVKLVFSLSVDNEVCSRFSCYYRALRVLTICYRFYIKCKKIKDSHFSSAKPIQSTELKIIKDKLILNAQKIHFQTEHEDLSNKSNLSKSSSLLKFNPFIDENLIIRMNSRLTNRNIAFNEKYPIILPSQSSFVKLYLNEIHRLTLHGNITLMMNIVRQEFWITKLKQLCKSIINQCKICTIYKQKTLKQIMSPLPSERILANSIFVHVCLDFAGPFQLKLFHGRCNRFTKGYVCVFVCCSTKAIHLEPVSDLSTKTFLQAFSRFYARRGLCRTVFCDNATNFIGAKNDLEKEYNSAIKRVSDEAAKKLAERQINFKFIPPSAPHFGGLHEAGVKSMKYHLRRICSNQSIAFEDLATILCQIEMILNSRPLTSLSEDPNEINALTPGHFLIGRPLLTHLDNSFDSPIEISNIKRFNEFQKIRKYFWDRWSKDYLNTLHQRSKWKNVEQNEILGKIVIIKEDNTPPTQWKLGRIIDLHKGKDDQVRVATVKTENRVLTRPIVKLCLLPD